MVSIDLARMARHLATPPGRLARALPSQDVVAIEEAIARSESRHTGQIRFAAEAALDLPLLLKGESARDRAIELFARLRVWDTEHNNGVLIYLLLADRSIEIVADRAVAARMGAAHLHGICRHMEAACKQGRFAQAVVCAIAAVTPHLAKDFPAVAGRAGNELPDQAALL